MAMAQALKLLPQLRFRKIALLTSNKAAVLLLRQPRQQSGRGYLCRIYHSIRQLKRKGNVVTVIWTPAHDDNKLKKIAKDRAQKATGPDTQPQTQRLGLKSTMLNVARAKRGTTRCLPEKVGSHSKRVDIALLGKHTRQLYDKLSWNEANVLAQLRTGMARLNSYLRRINSAPTDQCTCRYARETVDHFLFRCSKWTAFRTEMLQCTATHRSNVFFYLEYALGRWWSRRALSIATMSEAAPGMSGKGFIYYSAPPLEKSKASPVLRSLSAIAMASHFYDAVVIGAGMGGIYQGPRLLNSA